MRIFRKLAQMLDVNVAGVSDGDALVYDEETGKWIPGAGGGGGGASDAEDVDFTPAGGLSSTNVQDALEELDTEKAAVSHAHAGEDITSGTVADARIASTIARDSEVSAAISALSSVYQAKDTTLDTYAGIDPSANVQSVLGAANYAAMRTLLDLEAGTDFPSLATFDDHSARHEDGGSDEISIQGLAGTPVELTNHLNDTSDAHDASAISVADSGGNYTATDVEGVLAEIAPQLGAGSSESHAMLADYKSSGTAGGGFTNGAWQTRVLNTEVYDPDGIVSLSSNQFTLGAGTYRILWRAPAAGVNGHATRLQNVTDASTVAPGSSQVAAASPFVCNESTGSIRFTIAASKAFEIQHQCQTTKSTDGFGAAAAFTVSNEVYTQVWIVKE